MYKRWSIIIVVLGTFITKAISNSGKAALFLRSPAFEGDLPDADAAYDDMTSVDSGGAHKVLYGHYSAILETRKEQPAAQMDISLAGRSLNKKPGPHSQMKEKLTKIVEIFRKNLFLTIKTAVNNTRGGPSDAFTSQMESCKDTLKSCDDLGDLEIRCGVECLGKANDIFDSLTDPISTLVDRFCLPINTVFEKVFNLKGKRHPILRRFMVFLKLFAETKKSWLDVAARAAASLVPTIIDNVRTDMMPFRLLIDKLETELDAEQLLKPEVNPEKMISNSFCPNVDDADIAGDLLDVLYRNPTLVDAVLGGLTVMNLVTKYMLGNFRVPFAASSEAIRIMTGSICGLIGYAETGSVPSCDQMGGFPVSGIPLPNIPEMPDLEQECLQGMVMNGEEKDEKEGIDTTNAGVSKVAPPPPTGKPKPKTKRNAGFGMKGAKAVKDGAGDAESVSDVSGNGGGANAERKKRTLVVGKKA